MPEVLLTAEELHFLAAAYGLEVVPGLGPLPVDTEDPDLLALVVGTAARSLVARELGAYGPADMFMPALELDAFFASLPSATWSATAEFASDDEQGAAAWWGGEDFTVELLQLSSTDYALRTVDDELRDRLAAFLGLFDDDESVGDPEPVDPDTLADDPSMIARASHVRVVDEGAEGVALEWLDRGDGPVFVLEEDTLTPMGRAALLNELLSP